jgi:hypothetical protein
MPRLVASAQDLEEGLRRSAELVAEAARADVAAIRLGHLGRTLIVHRRHEIGDAPIDSLPTTLTVPLAVLPTEPLAWPTGDAQLSVQDDRRESELRQLFGLDHDPAQNRSGVDAVLTVGSTQIFFELKSTTDPRGSVTTVRDFSPDHVAKWEGKHWLFGFYNPGGLGLLYSVYGSPSDMAPWIDKMRDYVAPDLKLAQRLPSAVTLEDLWMICGEKEWYTIEDARKVQKRQYNSARYTSLADITVTVEGRPTPGYSSGRMLEVLRDRARYLILRGSTLNNPHIPGSYFAGWPHIIDNHPEELRQRVLAYLASGERGSDGTGDLIGNGRGDRIPDLAEDLVDAPDEAP